MQTASAFHAVHGALSYLVDSYTTIANWTAVLDRLTGFNGAIQRVETIEEREECDRLNSPDQSFSARSLSVFLPDGQVLLNDLNLHLKPGASLLVMGPSGSGKSTLLRALAGIWPSRGEPCFYPRPPRCCFCRRSRIFLSEPCGRLCTTRMQHRRQSPGYWRHLTSAISRIYRTFWTGATIGLNRFHWVSNSVSLLPGFYSTGLIMSSWTKLQRQWRKKSKRCSISL